MVPEKKAENKFSYADYLKWPEEESWELINGEAWAMSPAPASKHQRIAGEIFGQIWQQLKGKKCQVFPAPFDVRFIKEEQQDEQDIYDTVQPDVTVICDPSKIDDKGGIGAPDLVVEVLSPSTSYKDQTLKLSLYEEYGVKEYWIVNPERKTVQVFLHNGKDYDKPHYYKANEEIASRSPEGLTLILSDVFK